MKITKQRLKEIIKEELSEAGEDPFSMNAQDLGTNANASLRESIKKFDNAMSYIARLTETPHQYGLKGEGYDVKEEGRALQTALKLFQESLQIGLGETL